VPGNQVRGLLRPSGVKLPSRGRDESRRGGRPADPPMHAGIAALLDALESIDAQVAKLDDGLEELAHALQPSPGQINNPTLS